MVGLVTAMAAEVGARVVGDGGPVRDRPCGACGEWDPVFVWVARVTDATNPSVVVSACWVTVV